MPKDKKPVITVSTDANDVLDAYKLSENYIKNLALVSSIVYDTNIENIDKYVVLAFENSKVYMPLNELVDIDKEKVRLKDEIKKIEFEINRAKGMLNNEKFVSKAPKEKIEEEREKLKKYEKMLDDLSSTLAKL